MCISKISELTDIADLFVECHFRDLEAIYGRNLNIIKPVNYVYNHCGDSREIYGTNQALQ